MTDHIKSNVPLIKYACQRTSWGHDSIRTHAGLGVAASNIFPGRCPANQPSNLANDVTTKCYFQPLISEALQ